MDYSRSSCFGFAFSILLCTRILYRVLLAPFIKFFVFLLRCFFFITYGTDPYDCYRFNCLLSFINFISSKLQVFDILRFRLCLVHIFYVPLKYSYLIFTRICWFYCRSKYSHFSSFF